MDVLDGNYQHYKGGIYTVLGEALHTEEGYMLVIYMDRNTSTVYARPKTMFLENVILSDGTEVPRFIKL